MFAECSRLSYRSTIPSLTRNFASRHASDGPANLLQDPKEQTNGYKTTQKISIANLSNALTSTRKRCGEVGQGSLVRAALSESQNSLELLALDVSWSLFLLKAAAAACNSSRDVARSMPYRGGVPPCRWKGAHGQSLLAGVAVGSRGHDHLVVHTDQVRRC